MFCSVPNHEDKKRPSAAYRTTKDYDSEVVYLLCVLCMERARDVGIPEEHMLSLVHTGD